MNVEDELKTYILVIWRYKWVIAACTVISMVVALGISLILTPKYEAITTVRVASTPGGSSDYMYIGSLTRLTNTYVEIANSDLTLDEVAKQLNLSKPPKVEVEVVPETELFQIKTSNEDPVLARDIVNTLANIIVAQSLQLYGGDVPTAREILEEQLDQAKVDLETAVSDYEYALLRASFKATQQINTTPLPDPDLETLSHLVYVRQQIYGDLLQRYETAQTTEALRTNSITIAEPATIPEKPSSPKKILNVALGLVAGFVLGVILAFIFEGMDDTVREVEEVQSITDLPILGIIPDMKGKVGSEFGLMMSPDGHLTTIPAFDQLRVRITLMAHQTGPLKILVTSPEPGTGKSTIAANLAVSLTKGGKKVIMVDMDFRRPRQHTIFGLQNREGLSDYLREEIALDATLKATSLPELRVITAGSIQFDPFEWFTPTILDTLFSELEKECDYLLLDSPALLSVGDPMVLASRAEVVIMTVARFTTERRNLRFALHQLTGLNAKVAGIIMNKMPQTQLYSYYSMEAHEKSAKPKIFNLLRK